jgi:hypothetical protein
MKAILEFNLPEDQSDFDSAVNGAKAQSTLWQMDQWLRQQYKYMPDESYSEDKYNTYFEVREKLREIMSEHNINFDL